MNSQTVNRVKHKGKNIELKLHFIIEIRSAIPANAYLGQDKNFILEDVLPDGITSFALIPKDCE